MYFQSSTDLLNLVLAFCALLFTFFLCWALWYVVRMLRDASNIVGELRDKLHAIDQAIRGIKDKLEHSAGYLGILAGGAKMLMGLMERHRDKVVAKAESMAAKLKKKSKK